MLTLRRLIASVMFALALVTIILVCLIITGAFWFVPNDDLKEPNV